MPAGAEEVGVGVGPVGVTVGSGHRDWDRDHDRDRDRTVIINKDRDRDRDRDTTVIRETATTIEEQLLSIVVIRPRPSLRGDKPRARLGRAGLSKITLLA